MQAIVYRGANVVARALVEDIGVNEVSAHVVHTITTQVDLDAETRVQFAEAEQVSLVAQGRRLHGVR
jgi:hypothetical protein